MSAGAAYRGVEDLKAPKTLGNEQEGWRIAWRLETPLPF